MAAVYGYILDLGLSWHQLSDSFFDYLRLTTVHLGLRQWPYALTPNGLSPRYEVSMHGRHRDVTWTHLSSSAMARHTTITVETNTGWLLGDQIVIAPSGWGVDEGEIQTITTISGQVKGYPVIDGVLQLMDVTFAQFMANSLDTCHYGTFAIGNNPLSPESVHPVVMSRTTLLNCDTSSIVYFHDTNPDWINQEYWLNVSIAHRLAVDTDHTGPSTRPLSPAQRAIVAEDMMNVVDVSKILQSKPHRDKSGRLKSANTKHLSSSSQASSSSSRRSSSTNETTT